MDLKPTGSGRVNDQFNTEKNEGSLTPNKVNSRWGSITDMTFDEGWKWLTELILSLIGMGESTNTPIVITSSQTLQQDALNRTKEMLKMQVQTPTPPPIDLCDVLNNNIKIPYDTNTITTTWIEQDNGSYRGSAEIPITKFSNSFALQQSIQKSLLNKSMPGKIEVSRSMGHWNVEYTLTQNQAKILLNKWEKLKPDQVLISLNVLKSNSSILHFGLRKGQLSVTYAKPLNPLLYDEQIKEMKFEICRLIPGLKEENLIVKLNETTKTKTMVIDISMDDLNVHFHEKVLPHLSVKETEKSL